MLLAFLAEFSPLPDAERAELVAELQSEVYNEYFDRDAVNKMFKRCAAALSRPAPGWDEAWRPIETAPKDGTVILLWWQTCRTAAIGRWEVRGSHDGPSITYEGWKCHDDQVIPTNQNDCTHWMQLPGAPVAAIAHMKKEPGNG